MKAEFEELIESYIRDKVGIDSIFLGSSLTSGLRDEIQRLDREGEMSYAGVSNTRQLEKQDYRGDKIHWLGKNSGNSSEDEFLDRIDQFVDHLNRSCYTGINAYEFHYALYETGTSYKKHRDQFNNDNNRKYSMVSYLNEEWKDSDGGQLLIYQDGQPQAITPNSGKAVFFESAEMEHEVTVATRPRMSVTGWLKRM
ncbi:MAG: 2OG-Fe(II) oxygenase [Chitinophagaceae bacterium]|nr:MAG: 2OG-Fe(II) oxygenase [Chitinophagaceae bacterium]